MLKETVKPIILISSCKRDVENGYNQSIRDTWGADSPIDFKFFLGHGNVIQNPDEVLLNVPDDYGSLTAKTQASVQWALDNGYTHCFRSFTDTYIDPSRLLKSGFEKHHYIGNCFNCPGEPFCHGGPGYWLGPQAMPYVAKAVITATDNCEDQWVGHVLKTAYIEPVHDDRYSMGLSYNRHERRISDDNAVISEHLSLQRGEYHKRWMYESYTRRFKVPPPSWRRNSLIAVVTCEKNKDKVLSIVDTWYADALSAGYNVEFFDGKRLDCPDDYGSLVLKIQAICNWALNNGYSGIWKCDDDVFLRPDKLPKLTVPYAGHSFGTYAIGPLYWLSRDAVETIAHAKWDGQQTNEDMWVGSVLGPPTQIEGLEIAVNTEPKALLLEPSLIALLQVESPRRMREALSVKPTGRPCRKCNNAYFSIANALTKRCTKCGALKAALS